MNLKEWQNSGSTVRIQNPSLLTSGIKDMGVKNTTYGGMLPATAQGYVSFLPVDVNVRVPAKYSNGDYQFTLYGDNSAAYSNSYTFENGFCGQGSLSINVTDNSTILDFMPRMYVRLKKFSEFRAEFLNPSGYVGHFSARPIFNDYAAAKTYGYKFDSENISAFADDMYILAGYTLVTNKTDGTTQTDIYSYDFSTYMNSTIDIYDTWIPCNLKGTNYWAQGSAFIPYMRSLMAVRHYPDVNTAFAYYNKLPLYVGINGMISSGKAINAVNMFSVTASGSFTENPFMWVNSNPFGNSEWGILTSYPNNCQIIHYVVASKSTWKNLLNASGMAWSEDYNIVISPGGKGLNKPTFPGQPTNPVDTGDGDGDNISDSVEYPTVEYIPTAARYLYALNESKVNDVANYLFSETFLNDVRRLWVNPGDYIIDLAYYSIDFSESELIFAPGLDGSPVYIGNLNSGITGKNIVGGKAQIYGGFVDITEYYNSYLDYSPNTSLSIYIPYIGVRPLDIDLVNGHRIHLMYYFDLNTGQFIAALGLDGVISFDEIGNITGNIGQPIAQYSGNMAIHIPLNGTSSNSYILNSIVQSTQIVSSVGALMGGSAVGGISGIEKAVSNPLAKAETYGTLTPSTGLYCPQVAYLIINRPIAAEPEKFKEQVGYSSCYSSIGLGAYSGFLKCAAVDIPATSTMSDDEQKEIEELFLGGIYI